VRWLDELDDEPAEPAVPDAVAVHDDAGELVGWDESAAHAYLVANDLPSRCDDACAARNHVEPW
jgi:hypothetical protein